MNSKQAEMTAIDCVEAGNFILEDVINQELREPQNVDMSLTSFDLLIKDEASIEQLNEAAQFSQELIAMIETGQIFDYTDEQNPKLKTKTLDEKLAKVQQVLMMDITAPLNTMFDDFASYITKAI